MPGGELLEVSLLSKSKKVQDPFGFAQGRLFDSAGPSLREVPAPLKMTTWIGWLMSGNWELPSPPAICLYVIPCMDGLTGLP